MAGAYYNEFEPAAAHIIRALIDDGVLAPGDVDTRSIKEVMPDDLDGYTQCHFFAGGGLWSVAARLAGWPDDRPLWTGSCPCQPFSAAGKGLGTDDPRHLWPDFHRLISARRPAVVMGEQVAGAPGYGWFDGVRADLEGEGYASRAVDFPACSVDAPHQRNRLYWIAVEHATSERRGEGRSEPELRSGWPAPAGADAPSALDHSVGTGLEGYTGHGDGSGRPEQGRPVATTDGAVSASDVANGAGAGRHADTYAGVRGETQGQRPRNGELERPYGADSSDVAGAYAPRLYGQQPGAITGAQGEAKRQAHEWQRLRSDDWQHAHDRRNGTYWSGAEWLVCHDGKARRAEPGIRLLVDGLPGRVDLWRVGGNAIVPEAAAEVIRAYLDVEGVAA